MKLKIAILAVVFALAACSKEPTSVESTNNPEIQVGKLFEHEGCAVYRFYDHGYPHYYTVCDKSNKVQTNYMKSNPCGKGQNCPTNHRIETE